ncbi:AIPR family protein [Labrys sp. ZIDIC5]|uniref:AIPR family protein n=1 Tax=Labrys sedimenti TaxID=3106036 RepID=UPI002ACAF121|nr:AIPR family protein [Labrys sp. ZIDIC5]MDZ5454436.1 AIPR family protein [Labrys sp. ZIDIC5]
MTQSFLSELHAEVLHRASGGDGSTPDFRENVFTEYVMEMLSSEIGIVESPEAVHYQGEIGRGQARINGYALSDDDQEQDAVDLFVTVYRGFEEPTKILTKDLEDAAKQAVRFFQGALGDLHSRLDPAHDRFAMVQRIHEARQRIKRARLFILTDGLSDLARDKPKVVPLKDSAIELKIEFWDLERLARALASGRPQEEIAIDVVALAGSPLSCVALPNCENEYAAFVTVIPAPLLFRIYEEHGPRLLERNVRSFLQAKGKVNRGIRDSLKAQPGRFFAYNNGISLTADGVETQDLGNGTVGISRIRGLQVVNGGQTTASIHRAGKDRIDLSKVFVQAKLTVISPELTDEVAPRIAEFANTQNPIQMADFSANDPFHIEIERLSNVVWMPDQQGRWFYERARGQYFVALSNEGNTEARAKRFKEKTPAHRKFTKIELAKYLSAWDQLPNAVSLGGQKNFVQFTQRLRETKPKTWKPEEKFYKELVAKAILYREVTRIVQTGGFPDLRAQLVAYVVSALAFRSGGQFDLLFVWQEQRISILLENLIRSWAAEISRGIRDSAVQRKLSNYSEWCKKADCWKEVQKLALPFPAEMPPEFARIERKSGGWGVAPEEARTALQPDDLDAQTQCRRIAAEEWIRIIAWGTESGYLDARQKLVATELGAAAAAGWSKDIDARRAREGRAIINLAIENGGLEPPSAA